MDPIVAFVAFNLAAAAVAVLASAVVYFADLVSDALKGVSSHVSQRAVLDPGPAPQRGGAGSLYVVAGRNFGSDPSLA